MGPKGICIFKAFDALSKTAAAEFFIYLTRSLASIQQTFAL